MKAAGIVIVAVFLFCAIFIVEGCQYERPSIWEMKCGSCHDGKTVLNGESVSGMEQMKGRFQDMETFVDAQMNSYTITTTWVR